jgi:hypothetical protein
MYWLQLVITWFDLLDLAIGISFHSITFLQSDVTTFLTALSQLLQLDVLLDPRTDHRVLCK